jgi:hypothetical protein
VVSVETGEVVRTAKVQGKEDKFFDLQQKLAKELVKGSRRRLSRGDGGDGGAPAEEPHRRRTRDGGVLAGAAAPRLRRPRGAPSRSSARS